MAPFATGCLAVGSGTRWGTASGLAFRWSALVERRLVVSAAPSRSGPPVHWYRASVARREGAWGGAACGAFSFTALLLSR